MDKKQDWKKAARAFGTEYGQEWVEADEAPTPENGLVGVLWTFLDHPVFLVRLKELTQKALEAGRAVRIWFDRKDEVLYFEVFKPGEAKHLFCFDPTHPTQRMYITALQVIAAIKQDEVDNADLPF